MQRLIDFFDRIRDDARITTAHISLYTSLWKIWKDKGNLELLSIFSHEVMPVCKISSYSTYHKTIRQLHEFGYIKYVPSYNHCQGSLVYFVEINSKDKA